MRHLLMVLAVLVAPSLAWAADKPPASTSPGEGLLAALEADGALTPPKAPPIGTSRRGALAEAIKDADSVVFESGDFREVVFQVKSAKDRKVIEAFGDGIELSRDRYNRDTSQCGCVAHHPSLIRFQRHDVVLATISQQSPTFLSWDEQRAWFGDAELTLRGQHGLDAWFKQLGYSWRTFQAHQQVWWKEREARELAWLPPEVLSRLGADDALKKLPDRVALFVGASRLLGQTDVAARYRTVMDEAFLWEEPGNRHLHELAHATRVVAGDEVLEALKQLEGDPAGLRGAAQLFFIEEVWRRVPDPARGPWVARLAQVLLEEAAKTPEYFEDFWEAVIISLPQIRSPEVARFLRSILEEKDSLRKVAPPVESTKLLRQLGALLGLARMNAVTEQEVEALRPRYRCALEAVEAVEDGSWHIDSDAMKRNWRCESNTRALDLSIELLWKKPAHLEDLRSRHGEFIHAALDQLERAPSPEGIALLGRDGLILSGDHSLGDRGRALRLFTKLSGWQAPTGLDRQKLADEAEKWWRAKHPEMEK